MPSPVESAAASSRWVPRTCRFDQSDPDGSNLRRQSPAYVLRIERAGRRNQVARAVDLAPGVPQQHAAHPTGVEVVHHALAEWRDPLFDGFQARIEHADRLVAEVE